MKPEIGSALARESVEFILRRDPARDVCECLGHVIESMSKANVSFEELASTLATMVVMLVRLNEQTTMGAVLSVATGMMLHDPYRPLNETLHEARRTVILAGRAIGDD